MGIFKRVKTISLANMNHSLDNYEDPIKMAKQYIRDLEFEFEKAQAALANQIYFEQKHEGLMRQVKMTIEDRKKQQQLALDKNKDEMAKLAIQERLEHEKQLTLLEEQYTVIQNQTKELKDQLAKLKDIHADLQNRKSLLVSRTNVAGTTNTMNNTLFSTQSESIKNGFTRMEDKVLRLEAQATAHEYINEKAYKNDKTYSIDVEEEFLKAKEAYGKN
ncbi:PspA/IM30 family protein [Metabacillus halosaccharovorans]|uniref:PspA/IM30 family protein n=1 Tax=Metabacillus halosaccharovorans TaxID=930124 RepID=A0ABT3DI91_9BACI|nr:PspA/IM30 family protein [Metabacillus halosaccharovorans]MCV9886783.1 PspA/IM30 family protein [Metabacillus halosaccharovorans]